MANQFTLKNGGYEPFIGNYGLVPQPPIPEPAAEDNGKVLGVSDGSYALVNGGGGGGNSAVFEYLSTDFDTEEYQFVSSTFDIDDIEEAFFSGKPVMIKFPATDYTGEAMTILKSYAKLPEGAIGSPSVVIENIGNGIALSQIDENGKVCFSVSID